MGCYSGVDTAGQDADAPMAETDDAGESGDTDGTDGGDDTDGEQPAGCTPGDVPLATLVRMNQNGYVHALRDIFGTDVVDELEVALSAIPSTHIATSAPSLAHRATPRSPPR